MEAVSEFDRIVAAAKNGDVQTLKQLQFEHVWLDLSNGEYDSPAECLAVQGDFEAVKLLRWTFAANIHKIARGAAQGGHHQYAEALRAAGADITSIAYGAARGGHHEYANALQKDGACNNSIAAGAARGGHHEYAEKLRTKEGADIHDIAAGAARGKQNEYAGELRKRGADITAIAKGAAEGGNRKYAEALRAKGANVNETAFGAARGGHRQYAEELRAKGANVNETAFGAARGGHRQYAEALWVAGANINRIAMGAALGGHLSSKKAAWLFLAYCQNDKFAVALAKELSKEGYVKLEIPDNILAMIRPLQHLSYLRLYFSCDVHQSLVLHDGLREIAPENRGDRGALWCWLLQGQNASGCALTRDIFIRITQNAFPALAQLSSVEFEDLSFKVIKTFLSFSVKNYTSQLMWFKKHNQAAAKMFAMQLPAIQDRHALSTALTIEAKLTPSAADFVVIEAPALVNDEYSAIITRYRARLWPPQPVSRNHASAQPLLQPPLSSADDYDDYSDNEPIPYGY